MRKVLKITVMMLLVEWSTSNRNNYMETYLEKNIQRQTIQTYQPQGEDDCHPLFWFPRYIPESCSIKSEIKRIVKRQAVPMPQPMAIPMPAPLQPVPYGVPIIPPGPMVPVGPQPYPQFPLPFPPAPYPPGPYPAAPYPPGPYPAAPFPPQPPVPFFPPPPSYSGFVPGLPGIVSKEGGINIMPFTDVYSEMLERHKQKIMMEDMEKILKKYRKYPWNDKSYKKHYYD